MSRTRWFKPVFVTCVYQFLDLRRSVENGLSRLFLLALFLFYTSKACSRKSEDVWDLRNEALIEKMAAQLVHRGPGQQGVSVQTAFSWPITVFLLLI